jgi:hypothetical protein
MAKKLNDLEQLIKVKIYLEQIRYACQRLEKNFSFNSKDFNNAIENFNDGSQQRQAKQEIIKAAYSNLRNTLNNDLKNNVTELKDLEKLLRKVIK